MAMLCTRQQVASILLGPIRNFCHQEAISPPACCPIKGVWKCQHKEPLNHCLKKGLRPKSNTRRGQINNYFSPITSAARSSRGALVISKRNRLSIYSGWQVYLNSYVVVWSRQKSVLNAKELPKKLPALLNGPLWQMNYPQHQSRFGLLIVRPYFCHPFLN